MRGYPDFSVGIEEPMITGCADEPALSDSALWSRRGALKLGGATLAVLGLAACGLDDDGDPWALEHRRQAAHRAPVPTYHARTPEEWEGDAETADQRTRGISRAILNRATSRYDGRLNVLGKDQDDQHSWDRGWNGETNKGVLVTWDKGLLTLTAAGRIAASDKSVNHEPGHDNLRFVATYVVPHFGGKRRYVADMLDDAGVELYTATWTRGDEAGDIMVNRAQTGGTSGEVQNVSVGGVPATVEDNRERVNQSTGRALAVASELGLR